MKSTLIAPHLLVLLALAIGTAAGQGNVPTNSTVQTKLDVVYAVHDGVSLLGDLYMPTSSGRHAAMLLIHGDDFSSGSKAAYQNNWGPYLAAHGYVVFAIDYRLAKPNEPAWPQALLDCKAGLRYLRGDSGELGVDPERIGVGGDAAGAELAAMLAVTQDWFGFDQYPKDSYATVSTRIKVAVPVYGVYDMMAWESYSAATSNATPALDAFLGGPPNKQARAYFEASPTGYMRVASKSVGSTELAEDNAATSSPWFVVWGATDTVVPPESQSIPFVQALRDAGASVTAVPVPGVGHFWFTSTRLTGKQGAPKCEGTTAANFTCKGATPNDAIAARLLDFLAHNL